MNAIRLGWLWAVLALCLSVSPARTSADSYNKQRAVSYAQAYANSPNSSYPFYSDNDCTNFVSQALRAGGWTFQSGPYNSVTSWYFENSPRQPQDFSWFNADYLFHFILYSGRGEYIGWGTPSNPGGVGDLEPGDLIFADWYRNGHQHGNDGVMDHAMIVTKKDPDGTIRVSYHSNPHLDRPIQEVMNDPATGQYGRYHYVRLFRNYGAASIRVSESDAAAYDGAPGFFRHGTARYWHDASGVGDGGHMLWTWNNAGFIDNMGDWRPSLPDSRNYEVYVFIPRLHGTTTHAHYEIYSADGRNDVIVNQNNVYDGWVSLGVHRFNAGTGGLLRLTDMTGERNTSTQIGFDAAVWTPR